MNSVSLFVKTLVVITFMWCIAEVMLPENSIRKYSSFVYGLVIISLFVSAFTNMEYDKIFAFENTQNREEYNNLILKEVYEEKLGNVLIKKFGDESICVELTEDYKIKKISCKSKETYDDIMRYLNGQKN